MPGKHKATGSGRDGGDPGSICPIERDSHHAIPAPGARGKASLART